MLCSGIPAAPTIGQVVTVVTLCGRAVFRAAGECRAAAVLEIENPDGVLAVDYNAAMISISAA